MSSDLLRFTTAGSVDDGKSTLIGRLLYDSQAVYEDQLISARRASKNGAPGALDLSLLTDGLRAEREQGITIDVAYRYFATPRRKFIISDAPGHEQYTRNMATAASTADLAVILIDARQGVLPQSRRHAYITWLLGIPQMVIAVNKMDQVGFREDVFTELRTDFTAYAEKLGGRATLQFIPISALDGDNVVRRSERTPWYSGPSVLEYLEIAPAVTTRNLTDLRLPVQYVIRTGEFRGFAGQIVSGAFKRGDELLALPSGRVSRVRSIVTWDGELDEAFAPMAVTVRLEHEIDISRGDMLVSAGNAPQTGGAMEATLVWMSETPLRPGRSYLLKQTTQVVQGRVDDSIQQIDIDRLTLKPAAALKLNEIGRVQIRCARPLFFDSYRRNRATGSFILIDPITNETAAAGMVEAASLDGSSSVTVSSEERQRRNGHRPAVVLADSAEAAEFLERRLFEQGRHVYWLRDYAAAAVRALYDSGYICVLTSASDLAGWQDNVVRAVEFSDRDCLIRAIDTAVSLERESAQ